MRLLIADDSSIMRKLIKNQVEIFEMVNIVGEAVNGIMALEMVKEYNPDVVILDLHMPDMNGIEVLKEIKRITTKTVVCILTNYPYPQYKKKCLALGADYFLYKNEDFEKINIIIADILLENELEERRIN
jgi:DNA-binding NarL/FixJ family response regulator